MSSEVQQIINIGNLLKSQGFDGIDHLTHYAPVSAYVRIADIIEKHSSKSDKILDWGGGVGQMSHILQNRGFDTTYYCVGDNLPGELVKGFPDVLEKSHLGHHEFELPFEDKSFDVILSCGVLEHVPLLNESLKEIRRVLKPGGKFLIFHFPNRTSYTEKIAEWRGVSCHPRKFDTRELYLALTNSGYLVPEIWYAGFFPKSLIGMPRWIKAIYSKLNLEALDRFVCRLPFFRRFANAVECVAVKAQEMA